MWKWIAAWKLADGALGAAGLLRPASRLWELLTTLVPLAGSLGAWCLHSATPVLDAGGAALHPHWLRLILLLLQPLLLDIVLDHHLCLGAAALRTVLAGPPARLPP